MILFKKKINSFLRKWILWL